MTISRPVHDNEIAACGIGIVEFLVRFVLIEVEGHLGHFIDGKILAHHRPIVNPYLNIQRGLSVLAVVGNFLLGLGILLSDLLHHFSLRSLRLRLASKASPHQNGYGNIYQLLHTRFLFINPSLHQHFPYGSVLHAHKVKPALQTAESATVEAIYSLLCVVKLVGQALYCR